VEQPRVSAHQSLAGPGSGKGSFVLSTRERATGGTLMITNDRAVFQATLSPSGLGGGVALFASCQVMVSFDTALHTIYL
jgi:hypothetical protein